MAEFADGAAEAEEKAPALEFAARQIPKSGDVISRRLRVFFDSAQWLFQMPNQEGGIVPRM